MEEVDRRVDELEGTPEAATPNPELVVEVDVRSVEAEHEGQSRDLAHLVKDHCVDLSWDALRKTQVMGATPSLNNPG